MTDKEFHLQDHDLYRYVYDLTVQIPEGRVSTYGALARALGDLAASRAVGRVLSADRPRPFKVPCHRVVYSDGRTGWYNGAGKGAERKQELLRSEGVSINDGKVLNFEKTRFDDFLKDPILEKMAAVQRELAANVVQKGDALAFDRIAGLDVSYDGDKAFAAMVVLDRKGVVLEESVSECQVNFPYVPGYLGFREMRPYSLLLERRRQDTLYLIDGHGRAHPRRAGIASQFGVIHDVAAAGVGKSVLSGKVESDTLCLDGEEVGRVVKGPRGKARYVSVGHKVELDSLCQLVRSLPKDPLTMAHDLCSRVRRGEEHR
ncbi:MAG: endonuclease V [Methanomassiliicoccales archaeon]|nr:endonuclease V [Methanomassiliicoccales archaeon]TFG56974.1 MAG: methylated-DNA--[protein]-cysteine S-methyltransferase [Methanomassiliicoccus sp.]